MALTDNLVSHWSLNNTPNDSHGSNHLTPTSGGNFTWPAWVRVDGHNQYTHNNSSTHYLTVASNSSLAINDEPFMIAAWVRPHSNDPSFFPILSKTGGSGSEYTLFYRGSGSSTKDWRFQVYNGSSLLAASNATMSTFIRPYWYLVFAWYDGTNINVQVGVPDGDVITPSGLSSVSSTAVGGAIGNTSQVVEVGKLATNYASGFINNVSFWKGGFLSSSEREELWNNGLGITYPFNVQPLKNNEIIVDPFGRNTYQNQVGFRDNSVTSIVLSSTRYQAVMHWDQRSFMTVSVRNDGGTGTWGDFTLYRMNEQGGRPRIIPDSTDNHMAANVGIDKDGIIHTSYAMHNNPLKYAKANAAINSWTGAMTTGLSMLGTNETAVAYPTFFNAPDGTLYFTFRQSHRYWYLYVYDESTTSWSAAPGTGTDGVLVDAGGDWAYLDTPIFDPNFGSGGYLHISFMYRGMGKRGWDYNYIKWDGSDFYKYDNSAQTIPATQSNDSPFDPGTTFLNQNSIDVDSNNRPHISYWKGGANLDQLYHAHYNGTSWTITQLTDLPATNYETGLTCGRPRVIVDRDTDTCHVIYLVRTDENYPRQMLAYRSAPGDFTQWEQYVIYDADQGFHEPSYDRKYWEDVGTVHLYLDSHYQGVPTSPRQITLLTFDLEPMQVVGTVPRPGVVMLGGVGMV
jgi:hypothetical protein